MSDSSIRLDLRCSRIARVASLVLHSLTGLAIAWAPLPLLLQGLGIAMLVAAAWYADRHLREAPIQTLIWSSDGQWSMLDRQQRLRPLDLDRPTMVWPWMQLLKLRDRDQALHQVALFADSADPAELRKLRVRLLAELDRQPDPS